MTRPKFLIDENLSVALVAAAHDRGFECAHVAYAGYREWKDWNLLQEVATRDWVLVTNNVVEFRGRYRRIEIHPGVVFLVPNVRRTQQIELFGAALRDIDANPDLVNTALDHDTNGIRVRRYSLP